MSLVRSAFGRHPGGRGGERRSPAPFVVGVGRSGTTLLRLMLDAHPAMAIPPETHFIPQVKQACDQSSNPRKTLLDIVTSHRGWEDFGLSEDLLRERVAAIEPFDLGGSLRAFYKLYAEKMGKPLWGDKTPQYLGSMRSIQDLLPEARFVHLVRDGRDVALSYQKVWFGPDTVGEAARWWRAGIENAREQAGTLDHYMEIRYEDLLLDTEPILRKICRHIDLPWNAGLLDYHKTSGKRMRELDRDLPATKRKPDLTGQERMAIHALTSKPPQKDRIGRWRGEMPVDDREIFEEIAGTMLRDLGYQPG